MGKIYRKWAPSELEFIRENTGTTTDKIIALKISKMTGDIVSARMVNNQRRKMNISRSRGRPKKEQAIQYAIDVLETRSHAEGLDVTLKE